MWSYWQPLYYTWLAFIISQNNNLVLLSFTQVICKCKGGVLQKGQLSWNIFSTKKARVDPMVVLKSLKECPSQGSPFYLMIFLGRNKQTYLILILQALFGLKPGRPLWRALKSRYFVCIVLSFRNHIRYGLKMQTYSVHLGVKIGKGGMQMLQAVGGAFNLAIKSFAAEILFV